MARRTNRRVPDRGMTREIVSTAVGAAQTLSVGVLHLTETTVIEALRAVESIGNELGSAVVRAARGSIKAAGDIGGDLAMVGHGVSRGVAEPAREVGQNIARLAKGLWKVEAAHGRRPGARARKMPAKVPRRRRRSAA